MTEMRKAPDTKTQAKKSPMNWPVLAVVGVFIVFVVGVWVHNYSVTNAATIQPAVTSTK